MTDSAHTERAVELRAGDLLTRAREICEPMLQESVESLPNPLRRMAGYHLGWWDTAGVPTQAGFGKYLRPALVIAAARACGGSEAAALSAAVGVELVHNFSLVHDDIMDGDRTRRGYPAVWSVWGTSDAILLGDTLHALAYRVLVAGLPAPVAVEASRRLAVAVAEMCRGQSDDCAFETRPRVELGEYIQMAMDKTGALMGCACALGALSARADPETVSLMDCFGRKLGLAFQFTDDIIGIWGDPIITGKRAGNDLAGRKRSLPVVTALLSNSEAARELAELYESDTALGQEMVARAMALVDAAGGRRSAQRHADRQVQAAVDTLPAGLATADLMALANVIARRDGLISARNRRRPMHEPTFPASPREQ
ncbi:polyprenyl synthetase family protein [Streptomyces gardneri]|uniref:polyprenyl synthetase family protein n=1 Tax=Nocardia TaxID=1817 RepID=UPI001358CBE2|nr:polyprenyl synthetase family protein [Streptomyces gardneri]